MTAARDNGRSIIVADEDLMVQLADILEKMELVEAKLMRLRQQGSFRGASATNAGRVNGAKSSARTLAIKAVEVAKEAVLFCARFDDSYCRLKPQRMLEH